MSDKLTPAMEDYIEAIYILENENKVARVSDIGRMLNVRKASVVSAVSNLQGQNFLKHERYGYITLTDSGKRTAEKIYSKHKILLKFLTVHLKLDEEKAREEACKMEHVLSEETVEKLEEFISKKTRPVKPKSISKKHYAKGSAKNAGRKRKNTRRA